MNRILCSHEANIINAARTGCWDDSAKPHLKQCSHCREIAGITEWMGNIVRMDAQEAILPDSQLLFLNAQIASMQAAREMVLRPLVMAELVVRIMVIMALAVATLGIWHGFRLLTVNSSFSYLNVPPSVLTSAATLGTCIIAILFIKLVQPTLIED